ncbi:aldo/keto reductase [Streptomyces sp. NBC_01012]|uniref:aldo/keto reductase n=1 Tax=Streptomyces sp. NBC_01012 TaxID=2903717 RepID=UPI003866C707|nr:aldo/keto reductase [Streptomyces sp. NBC_01012]
MAGRVHEIAGKRGLSPAQVALAWVMRNPAVTSPIVGVTKPAQLADAVAAVAAVDIELRRGRGGLPGGALPAACGRLLGRVLLQVAPCGGLPVVTHGHHVVWRGHRVSVSGQLSAVILTRRARAEKRPTGRRPVRRPCRCRAHGTALSVAAAIMRA